MRKYIVVILVLISLVQTAYSSSINPVAYRAMQMQSYRSRYNTNAGPVPYWKAQSNYATRNRVYGDYSQYDSAVQRYNNYTQYSRRKK